MIQFHHFYIPAFDASDAEEDLNLFLRNRSIINIERHFHATDTTAGWFVCVQWRLDELDAEESFWSELEDLEDEDDGEDLVDADFEEDPQ